MSIPVATSRLRRWLPELLVLATLVALPVLSWLAGGSTDVLARILIWGLLGLGFDLLFGYTGLLSFGQAAFFGTGGFVAAWLLTAHVIASVWLAMLLGTLVAMAYSVIVGFLALRRVGIYFAMITLAFGQLSYFVENSPLSNWTGGENGLPGVPAPALGPIGGLAKAIGVDPLYVLIAGLFLIGYAFARRLVHSPVGAVLTAIRENPMRTAALGHHVPGYKLSVFVLAAGYAGLAGTLLGIYQSYMPPAAFELATSGQLVIQTVIGGAGTLLGPSIGAAIWLYLRDGLQQLPAIASLWKFILGAVFVILVTVLRTGIAGELVVLWRRFVGAGNGEGDGDTAATAAPAASPAPSPATASPAIAPRAAVEAKSAGAAAHGSALETREISRYYGGIRAVDNISISIPTGSLHAIIGPNGAGKSTLLRMLAGEVLPSAGRVLLHGDDVTGIGVTAACHRGIAKSYQINQLFPRLTVRQNLRIGVFGRVRGRMRLDVFRAVDGIPEAERMVDEILGRVGLTARADAPVNILAYGEKRRLEVGLALASRPSVMLLDEPLAGLSPEERQDVRELIRGLRDDCTIVLVEHDMDAVFELADRITVLQNGQLLAEGTAEEVQAETAVQEAYLGGVQAE